MSEENRVGPDLEKARRHPQDMDLYTPVTPELLRLFDRMRAEHGTWRKVAAISGTRLKVLRNLRTGKRRAVSQKLVDRLCTTTGVGGTHEFVWFTADDLVKMGLWKPVQYVAGLARIQDGNVHFRELDDIKKDRKQAKLEKKARMRIKAKAARKWTFPR